MAKIITPAEAKTLDEAFDSRHALISKDIVKREDNRSSWVSLQDLRDYLEAAESQTKELGYTMDGVRVYLGAYPTVNEEVGYTTIFFAPTGVAEASESNADAGSGGSPDIQEGICFNYGEEGNPPDSNYPQ